MAKKEFKGSSLMGPLPVTMVSVGNMENSNIITVAWTGIVCSAPPRVYVSIRKDRYSYDFVKNCGEFVINLVSDKLLPACDYCGIRSGRDMDKFAEMKLTKGKSTHVATPFINECPIALECKVFQVLELGSHDMFLADVVAIHVDEEIIDEKGRINFALAHLVNYQHGEYRATGRQLGRFGFAAQRKFVAKHGQGTDVEMATATLTKRKAPKNRKKQPKN